MKTDNRINPTRHKNHDVLDRVLRRAIKRWLKKFEYKKSENPEFFYGGKS
jgi:hypothetical protein